LNGVLGITLGTEGAELFVEGRHRLVAYVLIIGAPRHP
jgi:hypothetical protein